MHATSGVKALADVLAEVDGKGPRAVGGLPVHGAGTTFLRTAAAHRVQKAQVSQHLLQADLLAEESKVHLGSRGGRRCRWGIDGGWFWRYAGSSRGDPFCGGEVPFFCARPFLLVA